MKINILWDYWFGLYLGRHCIARGLSPKSINAYRGDLVMFRSFVEKRLGDKHPKLLTMGDVLEYIRYLQTERSNGPCAVNRQVMSIKNFFRAMVAFEEIAPKDNPVRDFPKMKVSPRKLPRSLDEEDIKAMIKSCDTSSVVGIRDRTLLILLYGTGIRASECAGLKGGDIDFNNSSIFVTGKGGNQRCVPLKREVKEALDVYLDVRGTQGIDKAFFLSMRGKGMSRNTIYERVRKAGERAHIGERTSPHRLRHSFATHLIRTEKNIQVVSELLGHKSIVSTQVYIHVAGYELVEAVEKHPIGSIVERIEEKMIGVKLPFRVPKRRATG